jgi:hypothetical protein
LGISGRWADECPVLIGQILLELLEFVVYLAGGKLIGNPDHGGEQMSDMFVITKEIFRIFSHYNKY